MTFWARILIPTGLLAGTIIGAGVFSLPYVFSVTGIGVSAVYAIVFCSVAVGICFMYADLLKRHPGQRYVGLMRDYFGKTGYALSFIVNDAQLILTLTIYIVLSASFSAFAFPSFPEHLSVFVFWAAGTAMLFVRVRKEAVGEFIATAGIVCIVLIVAILGAPKLIERGTDLFSVSGSYLLLPVGALLFSFGGRTVIPEIRDLTNGSVKRLRRIILGGSLIPLLLYFLFVIGVIGLHPSPTQDAISGLIGVLSPPLLFGIGVLGLLALWSSYVPISTDLKKTLQGDVHMGRWLAAGAVVLLPLLLYASGMRSFLSLVAVTGGILTALDWLFLVWMWKRSYRNSVHVQGLLIPRYSGTLFVVMTALLCAGLGYTVYLLADSL